MDRVNPGQLYQSLVSKFSSSPVNGYVPPDGARFGITTGSPQEYARMGLAVAKQESGFNPQSTNLRDPGGSYGLYQFNQGQFGLHGDAYNPEASTNAYVKSVEHYVPNGGVGAMGATFGSIRRPNETTQHLPWANTIADAGPLPDQSNQPQQFATRPMGLGGQSTMPPQQSDQGQGGGFFNQLAQNVQSPLAQGGLGLLLAASQGGNLAAGLQGGMNSGGAAIRNQAEIMKMQREQQRQAITDEFWKNIPNNKTLTSTLPPELLEIAKGLPPDQGSSILGNYVAHRSDLSQQGAIARQNADIALDKESRMKTQDQQRMFDMLNKFGVGFGAPASPAGQSPSPQPSAPSPVSSPKSEAEVQALPPGTVWRAPDGSLKRR